MREIKWENRALAELGSVSRGKSKHRPRNDKKLYGGDYPFIQTADVKNANFYINEFSQTYNDVGLKQSKLWEKDTLCITIAANIAETALLSFPACFPDSIVGFKPFENISDVRYIKYTLDNYKTEFQKRSKGATQDNLSVSKINSLKLLVPDYDYQVDVADVISKYDLLIENNRKRIRILEEMAQRLYTEWFVNFKFPGYEKNKMVDSETEFGEIPEGWKIGKISNLFSFVGGYAFKSKSYSDGGKYNVITIKNIGDGEFIINNVSKIDELPDNIKEEQLLKTGDVLMSLTGNIGRVCLALGENYLLNQRVAKIYSKVQCPSYAYYFFRDPVQKMLTNRLAYGAAQQNLSTINLGKSLTICPNENIIKQFEEKVAPVLSLTNNLFVKNSELSKIRNILIETFITGKRHLVDNNDVKKQ